MASYKDEELQMRFIDCPMSGGPEVMKMARKERPVLREGEVLIEVAFAGVNRPDLQQRAGKYPPPADASPILGLEVSGRITQMHDDERTKASGLSVGDEVCALTPGGGYAEYVAVPVEQVLPIPKNMTLEMAAGIPENYFTVWANVFRLGGLKKSESLLVHGGTSGIGTTAIQLAHALASTVYATAGNEKKCSFCVELGARGAVNYRSVDFEAEILEMTSEHGVDVILDMVAGDYTAKNLRLLARKGRLVQIAVMKGAEVTINMGLVMSKRLTLTGSTLRPMPVPEKAIVAKDLEEKVWPLLEAQTIRPIIDRVFKLEQAAEAHVYLEGGSHIGKILLRVRG